MKITKHIEGLAEKHGLGLIGKEVLQTIWNLRDEPRVVTTCLVSISASGGYLKIGTVVKGKFFPITKIVAKVIGAKYNPEKRALFVSGSGHDLSLSLTESLYMRLCSQKSMAATASRFNAVQSRVEL
ncbi:MAG: hypothetical protein VYA60_08090 [Pseudomonadota bacterium]|nr:hypothetical protein [Pseudomonadota bacterium]